MAILRMQEPRQLYGLGSLVKKALRGVKKIVKSPIGKAALMYAGTAGLGALGGGGFKGLSWLKPSMVMKNWGNAGILGKLKSGKGILGGFGNIFRQGGDPTKGFSVGRMLAGGLGATALAAPFMMGGDEEEEEEESWTNVPSSIADIRNQAKNYYTLGSAGSNLNFMPQKQFVDANYYAADGGRVGLLNGGEAGQEQIGRIPYQTGGTKITEIRRDDWTPTVMPPLQQVRRPPVETTQDEEDDADIRNQAKNYYTLGSAGSNLNFMPQKQFVDANYYAADGGRVGLLNGGRIGLADGGLDWDDYGSGTLESQGAGTGSTGVGDGDGNNDGNNVVVNNQPPVNPVIDNTVIDNTVPDNLMAGLTKKQMMLLDQRKNMYPDILGAQEMLDNISSEDDPDDPATIQNIKDYYAGTYVGAQGGRVELLNGGEAGQEQIEQMLMAEYIKYKNQGGQLTFEQFVQAVMQQQEGGMEQPQELPQEGEVIYAADGGRAGYAGGQLVRPSADGSRPGYSGIMEGIIAAFGKGMDKSIPKRKKDEDLTRDEAERIKMAVFEVLDQTAGGEKSTLSGTFIDNLGDSLEQFVRPDLSAYIKDYTQGTGIFAKDFIFGGKDDILKKAHGGRIGYNRGRVVNPGGYAGEEEGNIQLLWEAIKKQFDPKHWVDMFNFFSGKSGEINSSGFPPNLEIGEGFGSEALLPEDLKAHGGRIGLLSGGLLDDDEDETTYNPYAATKMYRRMGKQEGGIMESEAAEEMINMNGQEKDYRETGGFVNLGGKERADDVPARLSKNEFVFTADAVRAAGGGDIDAGSEVMQNMMDNLEQGGEISEESQGLEGAQAMYDQQQMLQSRIA